MLQAWLAGLILAFSLIAPIGAQNAFVLKQGLKKQGVLLVCLLCTLSDVTLIAIGVSGFYLVIEHLPWLNTLARYGGAAFLIVYGVFCLWRVWQHQPVAPNEHTNTHSLVKIACSCLAFTWLNPHVYLDTVFLLGSLSTQFSNNSLAFFLGTVTASTTFFFGLGYGAALLAPLFRSPLAWRILDLSIGVLMCSIAATLLLG